MNYSQHQIEKYLEERFKRPGIFLEIGCWDGELISQTAWLEREKGWSGVCVDPFPINFEKRKCTLVKKAISRNGEPRRFTKVSTDRRYGGDVSYFSGFTDKLLTHLALIQEHCNFEIVNVKTITFDLLILQYGLPTYIDFLSVDTEGSELEIFENIDFSSYFFGMIVFEHNENEQIRQGIGNILVSNGYRLLKELRCDDIYVSNNESQKE